MARNLQDLIANLVNDAIRHRAPLHSQDHALRRHMHVHMAGSLPPTLSKSERGNHRLARTIVLGKLGLNGHPPQNVAETAAEEEMATEALRNILAVAVTAIVAAAIKVVRLHEAVHQKQNASSLERKTIMSNIEVDQDLSVVPHHLHPHRGQTSV